MKEKSENTEKPTSASSVVTPKPILHHEILGTNTEYAGISQRMFGGSSTDTHKVFSDDSFTNIQTGTNLSSQASTAINTTVPVETTAPSSNSLLVETLLAGSNYYEEHEA